MGTKESQEETLAVSLTPSGVGGDDGELEVTVRVEIGDIRMSVREASSLIPGQILELERRIGPDVVLRVGSRVVGRGELVTYEGVMAVEIKDLP